MADTTSHDTVGASTLATPLFMPSSPPPHDEQAVRSPDINFSPLSDRASANPSQDAPPKESTTPRSSRASSPDSAADVLDARLAEYTVDFNLFPSGHIGVDEEPLPEPKLPHEDDLSDVGGPEDFTANLEKYLMGDDDTFEHKEIDEELHPESESGEEVDLPPLQEEEEEEDYNQEPDQEEQRPERQHDSSTHQPAVEDEAELGEYSEFEPPVDMSTPSHLLRRRNVLTKEVTHLEDIEEGSDDEPDTAATPSVRKHKPTLSQDNNTENEELRRQIAELKLAIQERDEQLDSQHQRILEAAAASEQIRHLQSELQRKTTQLNELHATRNDATLLREKIQVLQRENEEKDSILLRASVSESGISALQKQIGDMQRQLQNRSPPQDLEADRLETIAYLRQQLDLTQEQLKKRDVALDETSAKLKEVTSAKERQLLEKNAEVDGLKSQIDGYMSEIRRLEAEVERANREYNTLEGRIASLETKNRPLEEKNSSLEADLTRAQSQVTAQENALKAMAADLPLESGGNTYTEILELIKDLGQPTTTRPGEPLTKDKCTGDHELDHLRYEVARLQAELKGAVSTRTAVETQLARSQEQAAEAQSLINSIEAENSRLNQRLEEIKNSLDATQFERKQLKDGHAEVLDTLERLQQATKRSQPSALLSPPSPHQDTRAVEESHQAQLKSLQTAHTTAISTLRSSHAESSRKLRDLLSAAEKRETKLKSELMSLRSSRSTEDTQIDSLQTEIKRLESVITVKDEAAAAVDQRIARSVEKREKEWERRVDLLLKERERMSRVLMWTWGEKEMGEDKENVDEHGRRNQSYRYKHVPQNGKRRV